MNIGCDLDGVIIDHSYNQALMLAERGFIIPREKLSKQKLKTLLTPEQYSSFKKELYDIRSLSAQEITGATDALQTITSLGHEIRIISRRDTSSAHALQWLDTHGILSIIPQSHIHFVQTYAQKEEVCRQYDIQIHIDDSPEVFELLRTPRHHILFDQFGHHQGNKEKYKAVKEYFKHAQFISVRSWRDILNSLQHLDC